ncbi:trigger factor [Blautia schinkii]|nr:trigger factor [Blautia schinkii]
MSLQVEKMEKNMAKLTIEVSAEDLDKAMQSAYQKAKGKISIPGFRKGKAPRKMIEQMYGKGIFLEDAANALIPEHYSKALEECDLEIVSQPEIDVTQAEPGKPFIFTAEVAVKPEVTLGEYKGLEVPKAEIEVTDEEVDAEIKKEQEKNSRTVTIEDRAAQNDDIVTIDFEGFVDDVAFDGGKGTEYPLTLGSNTFIPGFEEQLVGAKTGDHVDVNVTFPEEYQAPELAGKAAVFKCEVKKIEAKELPELDDDFAKDVSEFDTLAEYKDSIRKNLVEKKESDAVRAKEDAAIDKVIENAEMEIPEAMIQSQCRQMADDFSRRMQSQGLSMEQYFQFTGLTAEKMMEDMKPQALKRIQTRLVLEKIAEVENIQPSEEEISEEISKMAEMYKMEADKLKELLGERELEQMKKDMAVQKAVTLVADAAKEV